MSAFLNAIADPKIRKECKAITAMMKDATGAQPQMYGASIVGFGSYRYQGASGSAEWFLTGFSPRKQNLTLYLMSGLSRHGALMQRLGKHKTGKSCLYIKSLDDIDLSTLRELLAESVAQLKTLKRA